MQSGKLDTLCSIEDPVLVPSTFGGPLPPTDAEDGPRAVVKRLWACIEGLKGRETELGQSKAAETTHRGTIRWHRNVKPHMVLMRVRDATRFDIVTSVDPTGKRQELWLTLREMSEWTASS